MTVPRSFQRRRTLSRTPVLHRGSVHKDDIETRFSVKVTRPLKTIADLLVTRTVQMDHMQQAVKQAFQRGLITHSGLAHNRRISAAIKKEIEQLRGTNNG